VLIPNGIDPAEFAPCQRSRVNVRRELGIEDSARLVGVVGRLHPMKDHRTFLTAAAMVVREDPSVAFVAVGRGVGGDPTLRRLAADLAIADRVRLLDERRDIPRVMSAFDVAVSSSRSEGFPNAVVEAMACAVPCVVTDTGDSAAIVGDTGVVVPPQDAAALAAGIRHLLAQPAADRAALGLAARERVVREYSIAQVAERYCELYQQLAQPRAGAGGGDGS
jgi:glycosyltransferase involved in cell wall biosynthesis